MELKCFAIRMTMWREWEFLKHSVWHGLSPTNVSPQHSGICAEQEVESF